MVITIDEAIKISSTINKLKFTAKFPFNIAWQIHSLKKRLNEIIEFALVQLNVILGENWESKEELNKDELCIYASYINQEVEVQADYIKYDWKNADIDGLFTQDDIDTLSLIFQE